MTNANELTKDFLTALVRDNPTAAVEYTWELRKTLSDANKRRMELATELATANAELDSLRAQASEMAAAGIEFVNAAYRAMGQVFPPKVEPAAVRLTKACLAVQKNGEDK